MSSRDTSYEYYTFEGDQNELLEYARSEDGVLARFWEIYTLFNLARNTEAIEKLEEYDHLFVDEWQSHLFFLKEIFLQVEGLETEETTKKFGQKFILGHYYWWMFAKTIVKN